VVIDECFSHVGNCDTITVTVVNVSKVSPEVMTLDELCSRVGLSVRNVRFYTTRGLVPPPIRRGRSGYYTPDHVVRLELVQELQAHGFTLAAIERYVARIPDSATPADIALHRTLLAPWMAEAHEVLTRGELADRAGRELSDDDLDTLAALSVATPLGQGCYEVALAHLSVAMGLVDVGFPTAAALAAKKVYAEHGRAIAEEIDEVFRGQVWPAYKDKGMSPEQLQQLVERLKPLSIAGLVSAYEAAVNETKRESIERRTR
jgi:DNA-binding transcriptional MerR regulator